MPTLVTAAQIGPALCAALGLPKYTKSFSLHCRVGSLATIECEFYPEDGGLVPVLANYGVVQLNATDARSPPPPPHYDTLLRQRTERAHREFMERTSRHLPSDRSTAEIARFFGIPPAMLNPE